MTICPCPPRALKKLNAQFGGNITNSSNTNAARYSQLVRMPAGRNPCGSLVNCTSTSNTVIINNPINAFGFYAGAPMGSGAPPKNYF
jgi:hypothetical protein